MPYIFDDYNPPLIFKNKHLNTISAALWRKQEKLPYQRKRFKLKDGDFVDLDYVHTGSDKIVVLIHGLEGSSDRAYIRGMAKKFSQNNFDVLAFNFRGCSGEPNLTLKGYHMAATEDLEEVINFLQQENKYASIYLIGFSLGGSVVLRFLSLISSNVTFNKVKGGITFSVPLHLVEANRAIDKWENLLYRLRFMMSLKKKMKQKQVQFPTIELLPSKWKYNFTFFDDFYTGPIHGFKNALDYWQKAGAINIMDRINLPCLLVNAADDSFLSKYCFPESLANYNSNFYFCKPKWGGHVGFMPVNKNGFLWSEDFAFQFLSEIHEKGNYVR